MSGRIDDLPQPFLAAEISGAAITHRVLTGAVGRGEVLRLARGVYAASAAWSQLSPRAQHSALARAAARAFPEATLSHRSAGLLLGLPHPRGRLGAPRMTLRDDDRTSRTKAWVQFHRGETPPEHVQIAGVRLTTPARTVIDCFREESFPDGVAIADGAVRKGLVTVPELVELRNHERRWPGVRKAARGIPIIDGRRESWLESYSAAVFFQRDIPVGVPQVIVLDWAGEFVARVDVAWPDRGVVGEADGQGKYLGEFEDGLGREPEDVARRVIAAAQRETRLRDLGLQVVRWDTTEIVSSPHRVVRRWQNAAWVADPSRVRAQFLCVCHRLDLTDCPQSTV
ncbi:hypothetical protein [Nostocoides sp. HKS02]|uniref:hypothetical protein n=1 Tax=Nostocoides sp. HKS02 TaxID=1813880 RepID=UPI0012B4534F|nr:hypothetical protein [Tetrasphaera sp. HKS02]QGN58920.1 hypothetical protein GKE56_14635 [Tetrasphaera sp. HKS02]